MNIAQEVGLGAAIDYLEALGMDAVREHEEEITAYAIDRLLDAGATRVRAHRRERPRRRGVASGTEDVHPHDLATILNEEGVAIRAGHHCNQLVMRRLRGAGHGARELLRVQHATTRSTRSSRRSRKAESVFGSEGRRVALDDIYKEVILDHYKNPRNKREMPDAELTCSKNNPLCGDEITVFVHGRTARCSRSRSSARGARSARARPR